MRPYSSSSAPSPLHDGGERQELVQGEAALRRPPPQLRRHDLRQRVEHRLHQRLRARGLLERVAPRRQVALERGALGPRREQGMAAGAPVGGVPGGAGNDGAGHAAGRRLVALDQELAQLLQAQPRLHADHELGRHAGAQAPDQLAGRRRARQQVAAGLQLRRGALVVEQQQEGLRIEQHAGVGGEAGDAGPAGPGRYHDLALADGGSHRDGRRAGPLVERGGRRLRRRLDQEAGAGEHERRVEQERDEHRQQRVTAAHGRPPARPRPRRPRGRPGSAAGSSPPRCRRAGAPGAEPALPPGAPPPPPPTS